MARKTRASDGVVPVGLRLGDRAPVTEEVLLGASNRQLDALFRAGPAGPVPAGVLDGVAVLFPGSPIARAAATLVRALAWQGKVIGPDGMSLRNRITPLGILAIVAAVRPAGSLVDGKPCVVLDYSATSFVARGIRDEIRLVAPHLYLGVVWLLGRRVAWFTLRERAVGEESR
jgi:hypothetical protein